MQPTKEDLMRLERLQMEMTEAEQNGELLEYVTDQAEYILHVLTMMTYVKGEVPSGKGTAA